MEVAKVKDFYHILPYSRFIQTCIVCPWQWETFDSLGPTVIIKERHERLTVKIDNDLVFELGRKLGAPWPYPPLNPILKTYKPEPELAEFHQLNPWSLAPLIWVAEKLKTAKICEFSGKPEEARLIESEEE